jgi:hypothetical protein
MKLLLEVVLGMVSMLYWVTNQPKVEHFPRASQNLLHREVQVGLDPIPFLASLLTVVSLQKYQCSMILSLASLLTVVSLQKYQCSMILSLVE